VRLAGSNTSSWPHCPKGRAAFVLSGGKGQAVNELVYQAHATDRDLDHKTISDWLNANGMDASCVREVAVYRVGDTHEIRATMFVRNDEGLKVRIGGKPLTEHVNMPVTVPLPDSLRATHQH
jgi:hypothetical protein